MTYDDLRHTEARRAALASAALAYSSGYDEGQRRRRITSVDGLCALPEHAVVLLVDRGWSYQRLDRLWRNPYTDAYTDDQLWQSAIRDSETGEAHILVLWEGGQG